VIFILVPHQRNITNCSSGNSSGDTRSQGGLDSSAA
jgi:hypothetical protein